MTCSHSTTCSATARRSAATWALVSYARYRTDRRQRGGRGCRKVWTNDELRPASVVSKGNSRNGILYTFENATDPLVPGADPWNWAAVSMRTGETLWKKRAGYGGRFNNHYAGIALGSRSKHGAHKRSGRRSKPTMYVGGVGGIMALRDR